MMLQMYYESIKRFYNAQIVPCFWMLAIPKPGALLRVDREWTAVSCVSQPHGGPSDPIQNMTIMPYSDIVVL